MLPPDILISRCIAHLNFLYGRILKEKKRQEFVDAMKIIITNIKHGDELVSGVGFDKYGGVKLAVETLDEIVKYTSERFVTGRSGDFYIEKL